MKKTLACIMMTSMMFTCLYGSSIPVLAEEINEEVITEEIYTTPDTVSEECSEDLEIHGEGESNGKCGDNLTWSLDDTGILTISGTGEMSDNEYCVPWFDQRERIKIVEIGTGVTSIGKGAFGLCRDLESVIIPDGVMSIGECAFGECVNLTSITIPGSVKNIGRGAFNRCTNLTSITISEGVTSIGDEAFEYLDHLTSITIPDSVTYIGEDAFDFCNSLAEINVGTNNKNYMSVDGALYEKGQTITLVLCPRAKTGNYVIPDGVTNIGDKAFAVCSKLTGITIPESVTNIGKCAFRHCEGLTSITIPGAVTSIGDHLFWGCSNLTDITLPDSVTSIESDAFAGCHNLTNITIPGNVTYIGAYAFQECDKLTSITVPGSVKEIDFIAFCNCGSLTEINVSANNKNYVSVDGVLFNKNKTTLIQFPGGRSGDYVIPNSVKHIEEYAFCHCAYITGVTIPVSVKSIGPYAFSDCGSLTDVYYEGSEAEWKAIDSGSNWFTNARIHNSLTPSSTSLVVKQKVDVKAYYNEIYQKYTVSPNANATVTNKGILTAKKPGTVTVTAYKKNGTQWEEGEKVELTIGLPIFRQKAVEATYQGQVLDIASLFNGDGCEPYSWASSNRKVATVDENGTVTVLGKGSTKISAVYGRGKNAVKYPITLNVAYPKISKAKATLQTGAMLKLKLNNTKKEVIWTSSDESLVTVDSGNVKALKAGVAQITATVDEKDYISEITIPAPVIKKDKFSIKVGKTVVVGLKNTKLKNIEWITSDKSVATVDSSGKVTGIAKGTAIISTTAGGETNSCIVTVTDTK